MAGIYPRTIFTSLSTSARLRCFERLTNRPNDWLTVDDDVVIAHWRRSILLAGGHGPLIAQLTDAFEQQRQRRTSTNRRLPTAELSALLGAYARVMEGPRRRRTASEPTLMPDSSCLTDEGISFPADAHSAKSCRLFGLRLDRDAAGGAGIVITDPAAGGTAGCCRLIGRSGNGYYSVLGARPYVADGPRQHLKPNLPKEAEAARWPLRSSSSLKSPSCFIPSQKASCPSS